MFAFINKGTLYFYYKKTYKKEYEAKDYTDLYLFKNDILCLTQEQIKLFLMDIKTKTIFYSIEIGYWTHFEQKYIFDLVDTGGDNFLIIKKFMKAGRGTFSSLYIITEYLKNDDEKYVEGCNIEIGGKKPLKILETEDKYFLFLRDDCIQILCNKNLLE